ncbi:hypothetical protein Tco_1389525 [Tanacetum coccineum]
MVSADVMELFDYHLDRFVESVKCRFGPSEYEDPQGALSKLLQLGTWEFLVSRPATLGDAFSLALITEARLDDDQAAPVAGMTAKTFGNNGGDESESSSLVTPTSEDDQSFAKEESYLSGDQYFLSKQIFIDEDELKLLCPDFVLK